MAKRIDSSNISTGQQLPINAQRLDYLQDNPNEIVDMLTKGLISYNTGDVIIVSGCVFTGTDPGARTMTAGSIYYNGLHYKVDAASFTTTGSNIPVWTKIDSFDDTGSPAIFSNTTTHAVEKNSKFVIVSGPVGGSGVFGYIADYNSAIVKPVVTLIRTKLLLDSTAWQAPTINLTNWDVSDYFPKCKKENQTVTLRLSVVAQSTPSSTICTLPVGFRPSESIFFAISYINAGGSAQTNRIGINTAGAVVMLTAPLNGEVIKFDFTFRID